MKTWQRIFWTMFAIFAIASMGILDWNTFMQGAKSSHSIIVLFDCAEISIATVFIGIFAWLMTGAVWKPEGNRV